MSDDPCDIVVDFLRLTRPIIDQGTQGLPSRVQLESLVLSYTLNVAQLKGQYSLWT